MASPFADIGVTSAMVDVLKQSPEGLREWLRAYRRTLVRFTHPDTARISTTDAATINQAFTALEAMDSAALMEAAAAYAQDGPGGRLATALQVARLQDEVARLVRNDAAAGAEAALARLALQLAPPAPNSPPPFPTTVRALGGWVFVGSCAAKQVSTSDRNCARIAADIAHVDGRGVLATRHVALELPHPCPRADAVQQLVARAAELRDEVAARRYGGEWEVRGVAAGLARVGPRPPGPLQDGSPPVRMPAAQVARVIAAQCAPEITRGRPPVLLCVEWDPDRETAMVCRVACPWSLAIAPGAVEARAVR